MNVYDFDGTIYEGDTMTRFYWFVFLRRPYILIFWPFAGLAWTFHGLHLLSRTNMKNIYYMFFLITDIKRLSVKFWDKNISRIKPWYKEVQRDDDLVISASPEFILKEICDRIGIKHIIGSKVNPKTGHFKGKNCRRMEKVRRLKAELGDVHIEKFYTDSEIDRPLAEMADEAYFVKGNTVERWDLERE